MAPEKGSVPADGIEIGGIPAHPSDGSLADPEATWPDSGPGDPTDATWADGSWGDAVRMHLRRARWIGSLNEQQLREARLVALMLPFLVMAFGCGFLATRAMPGAFFEIETTFYFFGLCSAIGYVVLSRRPLRHFKVTLDGWRPSLVRAACVVIAAAPILIGIRIVADWFGVLPAGTPMFQIRFGWIYPIVVVAQEFAHRGVSQTFFRDILGSHKHRVSLSVVLASLVFSFVHLLRPPLLATVSFFPSLVWGYSFEKDRTILGACLQHWFFGWFFLDVLGFYSIMMRPH
jgi:Type II CAAX prenyl endopeptidase Rce1-like